MKTHVHAYADDKSFGWTVGGIVTLQQASYVGGVAASDFRSDCAIPVVCCVAEVSCCVAMLAHLISSATCRSSISTVTFAAFLTAASVPWVTMLCCSCS